MKIKKFSLNKLFAFNEFCDPQVRLVFNVPSSVYQNVILG